MRIEPFRFEPAAGLAEDLRRRLDRARLPPQLAGAGGEGALSRAALERLVAGWAAFDWPAFAARVNALRNQAAYADDERLHFLHARSASPSATPILMAHGWPGSFLEFAQVQRLLTQERAGRSFHVVCPSLPGYGFSTRAGPRLWNVERIARALLSLMSALGYERFFVQGGDWGSRIATQVARIAPERCLGLHLNLLTVPRAEEVRSPAPVEPHEQAWLRANQALLREGMAYQAVQATRPQVLAYALCDSPVGLAAWVGEKFLAWSGRDAGGASLLTDAAILDQLALYWATNSIGSAMQLYHDEAAQPAPQTYVATPTGVQIYPQETYRTPRAWAEQRFNIIHWSFAARGGHFAALEAPEALADDIRGFAEAATREETRS